MGNHFKCFKCGELDEFCVCPAKDAERAKLTALMEHTGPTCSDSIHEAARVFQCNSAGEAQAEIERLKAGWGEAFKLAIMWQERAQKAEASLAERAPSDWRECAARACENESVDDSTGTEGDIAYNQAIRHCKAAILALPDLAGNAATAAPGDLPPMPEMLGLADLGSAVDTPPEWDEDYRATWQKLQVADANRRQWRAYALSLREVLASNAGAAIPEPLDDVRTLRRWAGQVERLASTFTDERALLCQQAGVLLYRIAYKPAAPSNPPVGAKERKAP